MKNLKSLFILGMIAIFFFLTLLLSSCEEIIVEKVYEKGDSIPYPVYVEVPTFVETSKETECVETDTLNAEIEIGNLLQNGEFSLDTLLHLNLACYALIKVRGYTLVPKDSVVEYLPGDSILYPVPQYDTVWQTIYDRTVVYLDTMVAVSYMRPVWSVPDDILPHVEEFYGLAHEYGRQSNGGVMIVQYVDELPGEGWTSNSFQVAENSQIVIQLDRRYPAELHRAGIFREMARITLGEKYTVMLDKIMNPTFSPETTIKQKHLDDLFK